MSQDLKSEGKCSFCGKKYSKAGITRHLQTHLRQLESENKGGISFLLKVEPDPYYGKNPGYFLSLWIDGDARMQDLDDFLRAIWLECCGHMSSFRNTKIASEGGMLAYFEAEELLGKGKTREYERLMEQAYGEIPMRRKAAKVLWEGLKLQYQYDYGSTTQLIVTVVSGYHTGADAKIVLLSRNEPLALYCDSCEKEPAVNLCTADGWDEDILLCENCDKDQTKKCPEFSDYTAMPVVNSPRMGVCGYEGGTIDTERDGVFEG